MGRGHDLGLQLNLWLEQAGDGGLSALGGGQGLANRLLDALGAEERLKGPLRDLCSQPLFLQALQARGAARHAAVEALNSHLASTYHPQVLGELRELVAVATGITPARGVEPVNHVPGDPELVDPKLAPRQLHSPALNDSDSPAPPPLGSPRQELQALGATLLAIAPGMGLAAAVALVIGWLGDELDRWLFEGWGWSGGVVLVLTLALIQLLSRGPLGAARKHWPLNSRWAGDRRRAWHWITAPWIHHRRGEMLVNGLALLVILGPSPLQLADVLLRYALSSLATLGLAAVVADRRQLLRRWDGASGAVGCLVGLGMVASLWKREALSYSVATLDVPAWVLLVLLLALQLRWQLAPQQRRERSRGWERLLSSQIGWGLLLGIAWGLVSHGLDLLHPLLQRHP